MDRTQDILIYYGWPNSFNSANNGWDNEKVAQDMAKYDLIVLGDGVQDPSHGDYANSSVIVPRVLELKEKVKIFGYVDMVQTVDNFKAKVDQWATLGVNAIFIDQAGYDFGTAATNSRQQLNEKVDYIHSKKMAVMVNSWNPSHVLDTSDDPSYPNSSFNPTWDDTNLRQFDWYLMENFGITQSNYENVTQWLNRGNKIKAIQRKQKIRVAAVSELANTDANAQNKYEFSQVSAAIFSLEAHGTSDTAYGASSAKVDRHNELDLDGLGNDLRTDKPNVQNSGNKYFRYTKEGRLELDFTSGQESSTVETH